MIEYFLREKFVQRQACNLCSMPSIMYLMHTFYRIRTTNAFIHDKCLLSFQNFFQRPHLASMYTLSLWYSPCILVSKIFIKRNCLVKKFTFNFYLQVNYNMQNVHEIISMYNQWLPNGG